MKINKTPTPEESKKLALLRRQVTVLMPRTMLFLLICLFAIRVLVSDQYEMLSITISLFIVGTMLVLMINLAFFKKCPRCSSWIGIPRGNCTDCGLKLDFNETVSSNE